MYYKREIRSAFPRGTFIFGTMTHRSKSCIAIIFYNLPEDPDPVYDPESKFYLFFGIHHWELL